MGRLSVCWNDLELDTMIWKLTLGGLIAASVAWASLQMVHQETGAPAEESPVCLLYTSDAADD